MLIDTSENKRLHLGCGQRIMAGYLNIDFPVESDSETLKAPDLSADLLELTAKSGSVAEIRLHHVFEHFQRPVACALLAAWHVWLQQNGVLRIEVPDAFRTSLAAFNPFTSSSLRFTALRHLFGSHEAAWAVHCEGYSRTVLASMLEAMGYTVTKTRRNSWKGTYNIDLTAVKNRPSDLVALREGARKYLTNYLVDNSPVETRLLNVWMSMYDEQLSKSLSSAS